MGQLGGARGRCSGARQRALQVDEDYIQQLWGSAMGQLWVRSMGQLWGRALWGSSMGQLWGRALWSGARQHALPVDEDYIQQLWGRAL